MNSVIRDLRALMPERPLRYPEAMGITERQAARLLLMRGIEGPPVPDSVIFNFPRVEFEYVYPMGVSGASQWQDGRWLVLINSAEPHTRQRYTAAHELKHFIDHQLKDTAYPAVGEFTSHERREQIADYFAATLLMPRKWVKRAWGEGIQDVAELARLFDVSREAMRYRLMAVGLTSRMPRCEVA